MRTPTIDFEMPPSACPFCGEIQDSACAAPGSADPTERPQPGDFTLCFDCGAALVFADDDLRLRKPSARESDEIERDRDCRRARAAWAEFRRKQRECRQ